MIASYHNHTYRCHHATGTERKYIENAIKGGVKYMGFSDHIPCVNLDGSESDYRVSMDDRFLYAKTVNALKEEYKGVIDIKLGYEAEYVPALVDRMLKVAYETGAEYLILGQHFISDEFIEPNISSKRSEAVEKLEGYVDQVCEGMRTGMFTYVAHPDVIDFRGDRGVYLEKMRRICRTSLETGVPLEINFLGIRDNRIYPARDFWKMVGEMGCDVVYGTDAHDNRAAYDAASYAVAEQMREEFGLNVIEIPKIVDIRKFTEKFAK